MTANDPGHVNNLDDKQRETLKAFWRALISTIDADPSKVVQSEIGDELFYAFGRDNPDMILLRWLRARKWQVPAAVQQTMDSLRWRHEWGLRKLMANGENDVNLEECASGKSYMMGKDRTGRPVTYVHASRHIKGQYPFEGTEKYIMLWTEIGMRLLEPPIEQGTVVLDLSNMGMHNLDYQQIKFMIDVAQNIYPETLGIALFVSPPWGFSTIWKIISAWLDPVVAAKVHFLKSPRDLVQYIDPTFLPQRLGGKQPDFKFIPPTKEDQDRIMVIRGDRTGMEQARLKHKEAAQYYLDVTLAWATTNVKNDEKEKMTRIKAAKELSDAFNQLVPYISTRTHFHRTGQLHEPIFDVVYNRVSTKDDEVTYF